MKIKDKKLPRNTEASESMLYDKENIDHLKISKVINKKELLNIYRRNKPKKILSA